MHQKVYWENLPGNLMSTNLLHRANRYVRIFYLTGIRENISGMVIVRRLDFGTPINDTARKFETRLTHWANDFITKQGIGR
jgi:hypothetical protein